MNYRFGLNDHDLLYASAADQARVAADLQALGATIHRCDVPIDQPVTAPIGPWAAIMRAANIQPVIVGTWQNLPTNGPAVMASLAKANPGIFWEYGNEWEAQQGGPTSARAATYVASFTQTVSAIKAADSTCEIGPNPVANINSGGWGWVWTQETFAAGLGSVPYNFHPFHAYSYPNNLPYPNAYLDFPTFMNQATAWGCKVPFWLTECGWQSATNGMTPSLQSLYMTDFLEFGIPANLPVVIAYELSDGGGETYGWYNTVGSDYYNNPKPVFTAVQQLLKPAPAPNYQSLYQAAIAQIQNVGVAQPTQWLAANPGQPARSYLASLAGKNAAWLKGHPAS